MKTKCEKSRGRGGRNLKVVERKRKAPGESIGFVSYGVGPYPSSVQKVSAARRQPSLSSSSSESSEDEEVTQKSRGKRRKASTDTERVAVDRKRLEEFTRTVRQVEASVLSSKVQVKKAEAELEGVMHKLGMLKAEIEELRGTSGS